MYSCKVLLDSLSPAGARLTSFVVSYPRIVHSELLTHRVLSRSSASSRAIPNTKLRERVELDPFTPEHWGTNQKGMQAGAELSEELSGQAAETWLNARDAMLSASEHLAKLGVHKQICNRLIEPWMFITVIVSATEWQNFFSLRCSDKAQPEIAKIAYMMRDAYAASAPINRYKHLPFIGAEDMNREGYYQYVCGAVPEVELVSAARCARVSYLNHDGTKDWDKDLALAKDLIANRHWSPFEHVALAGDIGRNYGNFRGWKQLRKFFRGESGAHWREEG